MIHSGRDTDRQTDRQTDIATWFKIIPQTENTTQFTQQKTNVSVKESNKFHNYETEKITCKASDAAEYMQLFGSSAPDRHARRI